MKSLSLLRSRCGSAIAVALIFTTILGAVGLASFMVIRNKYRVVHQAASWQEALFSAEAGVDLALTEIRKPLFGDPGSAWWSGWSQSNDASAVDGMTNGQSGASDSVFYRTSTIFLHEGEGGTRSYAQVAVDRPVSLNPPGTPMEEQWWRVRSLGVAEVPGGAIVAGDQQDLFLRKFDLRFNRRDGGAALTEGPRASRLIEAIVKPVGAFRVALLGIKTIDMTNHNVVVDSYDSRDPLKSTNKKWDAAKRQWNGDIATNGMVIDAGNANIYGWAMTNGGSADGYGVLDADNVHGHFPDDPSPLHNDFYQQILEVKAPTITPTLGAPSGTLNGTATITATPTVTNVILDEIRLSGQAILTIRAPRDAQGNRLTDAAGNLLPGFAQIVVNGNVSLSGQGMIAVEEGVYVRMFIKGASADLTGNGLANPNPPAHLQIYGTDRPTSDDGSFTPGTFKIAGNGDLSAAVYAPHYNVEIKGGGNSDAHVHGAFVGNTIFMNGHTSVHYDEALQDAGLIADYKVVSWFEDVR